MTLQADNRSVNRRLRKPLWAVAALLLVNAVLLVAQPALALPQGLEDFLFGPKLVRAEVILQDAAGVYDYRVDRGRIRERHRRRSLAPRAGRHRGDDSGGADGRGQLQRAAVSLTALRRGMTTTTVRLGDAPAHVVQAGR